MEILCPIKHISVLDGTSPPVLHYFINYNSKEWFLFNSHSSHTVTMKNDLIDYPCLPLCTGLVGNFIMGSITLASKGTSHNKLNIS